MEEIRMPWLGSYGDVQFHLEYPQGSMLDAVTQTAREYPEYTALSFMGSNISYKKMLERIDLAAKAFKAIGISEGDKVTVCMPNVPQTVYCLYALNRIGAIASMIHPLSAEGEIEFYLRTAGSKCAVTLDQFYGKFVNVRKNYPLQSLVITSVADALDPIKAAVFKLTSKIPPIPKTDAEVVMWKDFLAGGRKFTGEYKVEKSGSDEAVILFSGGTTGTTKGIRLSNLNFNALGRQTIAMANNFEPGMSMLAAMPMFHGFGLGVCVHTMLAAGGRSILVPRFNVKSYSKLLKTEKPNYIAGVPTLFEAITRNPYMDKVNLKCLKGVFSGGDSLSIELKKKFDKFLADHGAQIRIREGYGTTECVTASCLTPYNKEKEGSIGLPYPDTYFIICKVGTDEEVPYGEDGEICIHGPSVMLGYMNNPEETAAALHTHADGRVWLHTGDMGYMDDEGFVYFKQRIKRMIITSGYNVYPSQLENIIDAHEAVVMSCVIGVKDDYKMQKVKAFIVPKEGYEPSDELKSSIMEHCRKHIAKYAMPYDIEFRKELPKTLVGKVAYTVLEKEEAENQAAGA
ncbi:MAG: class I adenylate-forming enzyme family protein [Eubacteriales bacterium]